jgi:Spy/CpxP family protein refolding chaperone
MRMMGGPGMELHMIVRKLSLTQSQQEALDKITESHRSNFRSLFKQMHDLRKKVDAKFFSDTPPSASDADVVALESLRGKMASEGLASSLEVRAFLVKENLWPKAVEVWKKMQAMREQMRSFFEEKQ